MRRIVDAAMRVLADDPRAGMQTIAEASGLGRATVYRHFATRDELAEAIYRQSLDDAERAVVDAIAAGGTTREQLLRMTGALLRNGERYRMVVDRAGIDPAHAGREEEVGVPIVGLMQEGQNDGLLRRDLDVRWLAEAWTALLLQVLRNPERRGSDPDELAALVIDTFIAGAGTR